MNEEYVAAHTVGVAQMRSTARRWTPDAVAETCGVAADDARAAAGRVVGVCGEMPMTSTPVGVDVIESLSGGVLLSHEVPLAVPSAQLGLASGFGMEPGVSPTL